MRWRARYSALRIDICCGTRGIYIALVTAGDISKFCEAELYRIYTVNISSCESTYRNSMERVLYEKRKENRSLADHCGGDFRALHHLSLVVQGHRSRRRQREYDAHHRHQHSGVHRQAGPHRRCGAADQMAV